MEQNMSMKCYLALQRVFESKKAPWQRLSLLDRFRNFDPKALEEHFGHINKHQAYILWLWLEYCANYSGIPWIRFSWSSTSTRKELAGKSLDMKAFILFYELMWLSHPHFHITGRSWEPTTPHRNCVTLSEGVYKASSKEYLGDKCCIFVPQKVRS